MFNILRYNGFSSWLPFFIKSSFVCITDFISSPLPIFSIFVQLRVDIIHFRAKYDIFKISQQCRNHETLLNIRFLNDSSKSFFILEYVRKKGKNKNERRAILIKIKMKMKEMKNCSFLRHINLYRERCTTRCTHI